MNIRNTLILVAALAFGSPLMAQDTSVADLAAETGLSKQEVRMLIGARTPYAGYRVGFERTRKQLIAAVGKARYKEMLAEVPPAVVTAG